jgi:hypothetical protein
MEPLVRAIWNQPHGVWNTPGNWTRGRHYELRPSMWRTYNPTYILYISQLLKRCDILCIQEHWLYNFQSTFISDNLEGWEVAVDKTHIHIQGPKEINHTTLMQWFNKRQKNQELSVLLQGTDFPPARIIAREPLPPAKSLISEPIRHLPQEHQFDVPEDTAGQDHCAHRARRRLALDLLLLFLFHLLLSCSILCLLSSYQRESDCPSSLVRS